MTKEQFIEVSATIAGYIIEQTYPNYPYVDDGKGNVSYSEDAQEEFNMLCDMVENILSAYVDVGQHVTVEEV